MTFVCKTCKDATKANNDAIQNERVSVPREGIEVVEHFSYLGDTIQRDGRCERAVADE